MTEKRKEELLARVLRGFAECSDGVETYRFLHDDFGITNEELVECGLDRLRKHFRYEWAEGTPQREYANMLDRLLPAPDVYTTALWMGFAEEIADGAESSFEQEANALGRCVPGDLKAVKPSCRGNGLSGDPCASQCAVK